MDFPMEIVQANTQAMLIVNNNEEADSYFGLPSSYQAVVCIQSTGTQYIDTGFTITPNTKTRADFQYTSLTQAACIDGVGSNTTGTSGATYEWYLGDSAGYFKFGLGDGTNQTGTWDNRVKASDTNRHIFESRNGGAKMYNTSGTQEASVTTAKTITRNCSHSSIIFGCWDSVNNVVYNKSSGRLYSYKIWDNDILVRDFIPCYRKSDGVIGLFDLVNRTFYTNSGTGTFLKGADIADLPTTYKQIEYIQSSASNIGTKYSSGQVIDTGFTPTPNTKISVEMQFTNQTVQSRLFGVQTEETGYLTFSAYINGSSKRARAFKDGVGDWLTTNVGVDGARHTFEMDKNYYKIYTNGSQIYSGANSNTPTKSGHHTLPLFCAYENTGDSGQIYNKYVQHGSSRLYYCKIWDNGVLVRDLIPCYRISDSAAGLYDTVNNQFYPNVGSGTFTKGPNI